MESKRSIAVVMLFMAAMFAIIVVIMFFVMYTSRLHWSHRYRCDLCHWGWCIAAAYCRTGRAANRRAQNCPILSADVIADGSTGGSAYCTTDNGTAIYGIGIGAGGKEQGDC